MKKNYSAWQINYQDFHKQLSLTEQIYFLIRFAVLAPSGHNSQPWKFSVKKTTVFLKPEIQRAIPMSDPAQRQMFISLGCALENFLIAADYYNLKNKIEYIDDKTYGIMTKIVIEKSKSTKDEKEHLIFSIPKRRTNRNKYLERLPEKEFINKITNLSNNDARIELINKKDIKDSLAQIAIEAQIEAMEDKNFRKELSEYLKSNITDSKLGMPAVGFGIPTLISFFAPTLIKYINVNKLSRKKDETLLKKYTPFLGIISTAKDNKESWIKAGRLYEQIALEAEKQNLSTAPLAAAIQTKNFHKDIQKLIQSNFRPQLIFRLGYSEKIAGHTPRLTAEEITEI